MHDDRSSQDPRARLLATIERHLRARGDEGDWLLNLADREYQAQLDDHERPVDRLDIFLQVLEFHFVTEPSALVRSQQVLAALHGRHHGDALHVTFKSDSDSEGIGLDNILDANRGELPLDVVKSHSAILSELRALIE